MNISKLIRVIAALLLASCQQAIASPMEFTLLPPNEPRNVFGNAWNIYGDGEIDTTTAAKLQYILGKNNIADRSTLYLNSRGGSLIGGLELGEVIRKYGLYTNVAKLISIKKTPSINGGDFKQGNTAKGICLSACVLSYVGGDFRFLLKDSVLGVHRFYSKSNPIGSDQTQIASSALIQYFKRMGVDESLYSEMAKAGADEMNLLPRATAINLRLVDEGYGETKWTIESIEGGLYAKGERRTWRGVNKFLTACDITNKKLLTTYIFDAEGRSKELAGMKSISIFTDASTLPAKDYLMGEPMIINNTVTVNFLLPFQTLTAILNSQGTGISFQHSYESPIFLGFIGMDLSAGKEKMKNIIDVCRIK